MPTTLSVGALLALLAGVALGGLTPAAEPPPSDADPPAILVLPLTELAPRHAAFKIRARIIDESGVEQAVAYVKTEGDPAYTPLPMQPSGSEDDEYVATVPAGPRQGSSVSYYIEATDRVGNGPISNGNPRTPFIARLEPRPDAAAEAGGDEQASALGAIPVIAGIGAVVLVVAWRIHAGRRRLERDYWLRLLSPIMGTSGTDRADALDQLCSRTECHPLRGQVRVTRREVMDWLARLGPKLARPTRTSPPTAPPASTPAASPSPRTDEAAATHEAGRKPTSSARDRWGNRANRTGSAAEPAVEKQKAAPARIRKQAQTHPAPDLPAAPDEGSPLGRLDEEIFWIQLLEPIVRLPHEAAERALLELASKPIQHPRGRRLFDMKTLRTWLDWTRKNDPRQSAGAIDPAFSGVSGQPGRPHRGSDGVSLIELLAVMAVLGLVVGVTAINLKPLDAPVRTGGQLLRSLLEDTRARAIATTTVHRVRPVTDRLLIVEYADSCASGTWTLDPDRELELPRDVELADTLWSVCYSSRGLAAQNIVLTLNHPDHPTEQLEILAGGAVRTLD